VSRVDDSGLVALSLGFMVQRFMSRDLGCRVQRFRA
jgi:hypothetical protein